MDASATEMAGMDIQIHVITHRLYESSFDRLFFCKCQEPCIECDKGGVISVPDALFTPAPTPALHRHS